MMIDDDLLQHKTIILFLVDFFRCAHDPCRPGVKDSVHLCQNAGVKVLQNTVATLGFEELMKKIQKQQLSHPIPFATLDADEERSLVLIVLLKYDRALWSGVCLYLSDLLKIVIWFIVQPGKWIWIFQS